MQTDNGTRSYVPRLPLFAGVGGAALGLRVRAGARGGDRLDAVVGHADRGRLGLRGRPGNTHAHAHTHTHTHTHTQDAVTDLSDCSLDGLK